MEEHKRGSREGEGRKGDREGGEGREEREGLKERDRKRGRRRKGWGEMEIIWLMNPLFHQIWL